MSDNIIQLNEAAIKGELKELVKNSVWASMIGYTFNPTLRVKGKVEISEENTT